MVERRPLIEGLKPATSVPPVDRRREHEFVHGGRETTSSPTASAGSPFTRVPISTRMRSEFALALKKASLQRQLDGVEPNTLQDILEEAIEPWLKSNGYIR